jgi:hypothetical protein
MGFRRRGSKWVREPPPLVLVGITNCDKKGGSQRLAIAMIDSSVSIQTVLLFAPLPVRAIIHRNDRAAQAPPLHGTSSLASCCEFFFIDL